MNAINKKAIVIISVVIAVLLVVLFLYVYVKIQVDKALEEITIGKYMVISVPEHFDKESLENLLTSEKTHWSLLNDSAIDDLLQYLESNDLIIVEGTYRLNQTDTFEELKESFKFRKK